MATTVAKLLATLGLDSTEFHKGLGDAETAGSRFGSTMAGLSKVGGGILAAGFATAAAGAVLLGKELYTDIQIAMDSQRVQAQLEAVLKSTGGAAGVTALQVERYSDAMAHRTGVDDEAITSMQSMLLTFTDIGSNVFPVASTAVLDMATAMNGGVIPSAEELRQQTIQLGKALQDPDAGLGALARVGVNVEELEKQFNPLMTKEEKQILILEELSKEFGGSAVAAGKTFAGQLAILGVDIENIRENIGAKLLPVLGNLASMFSDYIMRPEVQAFLDDLATSISNFALSVIEGIPKVIAWFKSAFIWLSNNQGVIVGALAAIGVAIAAFVYTTVIPALVSFIVAAAPVILVMAAIGLAGYLLYRAWTENWGGIQEKMAAVWAFIQPILQQVWNWLQVNIPLALQFLADLWTGTLLPAIQAFWAWLQPKLSELWSWLSTNIPLAIQKLSEFWTTVLLPAVMQAWSWIQTNIIPLFQAIANLISTSVNVALTAMAGIWQNVVAPALQTAAKWLGEKLQPAFQWIGNFWKTTLYPALQAMAKWFGTNVVNALNAVSTAIQGIIKWIKDMTDKLKNIQLPWWMTPGSPTPLELGLIGIHDAMRDINRMSLPGLELAVPAVASSSFTGASSNNDLTAILERIANKRELDEGVLTRMIRDAISQAQVKR